MNEIIGIIPHKFRRRGFGVACTLLLRARAELPWTGRAAARAGAGARRPESRRRRAAGPHLHGAGLHVAAQFRADGLRRRGGRYRPQMPDKSLAGAHRAQLHLRPLPHPFAAALRHLPRPGTAVRQVVELGRAGPQRQCRLSGLHGRRAETRRRHRRRSAAAGAAFRALLWYAPVAAALAVAVFLPSVWIYYGLVRNRINRYGELENKAQREKARLVAETFRGYADIEINNAFPMMLRSFDRAMDQVIRTRLRETAIGMLPQAFTEIGLALGMALLVALSLGAEEGRTQRFSASSP